MSAFFIIYNAIKYNLYARLICIVPLLLYLFVCLNLGAELLYCVYNIQIQNNKLPVQCANECKKYLCTMCCTYFKYPLACNK